VDVSSDLFWGFIGYFLDCFLVVKEGVEDKGTSLSLGLRSISGILMMLLCSLTIGALLVFNILEVVALILFVGGLASILFVLLILDQSSIEHPKKTDW